MKLLGYDLNKKGLLYNYKLDFNDQGQFHGLVISIWEEQRKIDPTFGTARNRAHAPPDLLQRVCDAIKIGKLKPMTDAHHLQWLVEFGNGVFCGLRGQKEHVELPMDHVIRGTREGGYGCHCPFLPKTSPKTENID
jgi:hypothetical protein